MVERTRPEAQTPDVVDDESLVIAAIATDGSLYPVGKLDAHRRGLRHLAVSVFVFAGTKLLIQRRAAGKYHCGGLWANTCCTHPHWGETPARCAERRLGEEVGLSLPLDACGIVEYRAEVGRGLVEHERVHVFRGTLARPVALPDLNANEVDGVRWIEQDELIAEVAEHPDRFTPWLRIYLSRWSELALKPAA